MNKLCVVLILIMLIGCKSEGTRNSAESIKLNKKISSGNKRAIDSLIIVGSISPDSIPLAPPTQEEEKKRLSKSYDDIKIIDSIFYIDNDTLHFHLKYYCLKNMSLIIPKLYDDNEQNPKDFVTHPFAADISITNGKDTILNKQFTASDFYPFFTNNFGGNLKKYASIVEPYIHQKNKDKNHIRVGFSISIPTTDLGIGVTMMIDKKGIYKIGDNN